MKRTYLVTGANRGIGLATVKELSKDTNNLVLLGSRILAHGEEEARNLGANVVAVKIDLSTNESLESDIAKIKSEYSNIDTLINNAAILHRQNFQELEPEEFELSMHTNLNSCFRLIKNLSPKMIDQDYGRIVNITSGWGCFSEGLTGPTAYAVSKAALNALTYSLSQQFPDNVKINSMCPGWVRTRMGGEAANRSPAEGAETAVWLSNLPEDGPTGLFFRDKKPIAW